MMNLAVYTPENQATSYKIITNNICEHLINCGANIEYFITPRNIPHKANIIWNPNVGGGYNSQITKLETNIPIVITFHGARLYSLNRKEFGANYYQFFQIIKDRIKQKQLWKKHRNDFAQIVAVSEYSKSELVKHLKIKPEKIQVIYNAINPTEFFDSKSERKYFLHISEYQPVKNLNRTIEAYLQAIKIEPKLPDFWIASRNFPKSDIHKKIKILENRFRTTYEIAELYQNAFCFLFPSLHEGFGIPIIEAMACGSPVISSKTTACSEIALNSAILVNPRSTTEITNAIIKISKDKKFYVDLQNRGLQRSSFFRWNNAAAEYYTLFKKIINEI